MATLDDVRKILGKRNVSMEVSNPTLWVSSGNYALNKMITGDFVKGVPNKKTVLYWGPSGSGKSYLACAAAKEAQDAGYVVIYIDTEHAIHEDYLKSIGVDLDPEKFALINIGVIDGKDGIRKTMSELFATFDPEDKICYVIDSLSNLQTEREANAFDDGEVANDMGLKSKMLKNFVTNMNYKIGERDNFLIMTCHAYQNQDIRNGEGAWICNGGKGIQFLPSISLLMTHLKNREGGVINGIKIRAEITKSRFSPGKGLKHEMIVPHDSGIDPYDGLLEVAVNDGLIKRAGAWYSFTDSDGKEVKFQGSKGFTPEVATQLFDFGGIEVVDYEAE